MNDKTKLLLQSLIPGSIITTIFALLHFNLLYKFSFNQVFFLVLVAFLIIWPKICIRKYKIDSKRKKELKYSAIFGIVSGIGIIALFILYFNFNKSFFIQNSGIIKKYISSSNLDTFFIFFVIYTCIINPIIEEYYWRRYLYIGYRKIFGITVSITLASFAFGLHHYVLLFILFPADFAFIVGTLVVIGGAIWCFILEKYNSILGCVISHSLADIAIIYIVYNLLYGNLIL